MSSPYVYDGIPNKCLSDLSILEHLPGVSESYNAYNALYAYNIYSGGRATLDRPQYSPDTLTARTGPRYRNNNEECMSNNQCESNYCNMTTSGTPAQNININITSNQPNRPNDPNKPNRPNDPNKPNRPNLRVGRCTDVDNGLPSCLQQARAHVINLSM